MKTSFKLFYYYFVINDIWNNIAFQINDNIIYEYTLNMHMGITMILILFMKIKMLGIII